MIKKSVLIGIVSLFVLIVFLLFPNEMLLAAASGISICGKIIIPSLFPFTVLALILFNSGFAFVLGKLLNPVSLKVFGLDGHLFAIVIMSFIGGFPVGAKLVNQSVKNELITEKTANRMLYYSVNPGPAFVIIGIGEAIFHRTDIGIIIYISNLITSLILCLICSFKERKSINKLTIEKSKKTYIADTFVNSVADACSSIISICGFVILFSTIIGVLLSVFPVENIKPLIALLEISNGTVLYSRNIYILSFLTAFSGFCVHAQIMSVSKNFRVRYIPFMLVRIFSGILSVLFTFIMIKIFKPSITTLAINADYIFDLSAETIVLSAALIFMSMTLLISVKQKYVENKRYL